MFEVVIGSLTGISHLLANIWSPIIAMGAPPEGGGSGSIIAQFGFLIPLFLIMYLMIIRPQQKRQKEHKKMLGELKKGDRVVTSGGMFGDIFAFNEKRDSVVLKVGEAKMEFLKSSIASKVDN